MSYHKLLCCGRFTVLQQLVDLDKIRQIIWFIIRCFHMLRYFLPLMALVYDLSHTGRMHIKADFLLYFQKWTCEDDGHSGRYSGYGSEDEDDDDSPEQESEEEEGEESDGTRQIRHLIEGEEQWNRRIARHDKLAARRERMSAGQETSDETSLGMKTYYFFSSSTLYLIFKIVVEVSPHEENQPVYLDDQPKMNAVWTQRWWAHRSWSATISRSLSIDLIVVCSKQDENLRQTFSQTRSFKTVFTQLNALNALVKHKKMNKCEHCQVFSHVWLT